eukprot:TRINITY_DN3065_c0_g2_i1.p2 TRINITY_DN3065_c0_g2~~TRINITY_DN3065_c0_g2_i1.p2  ORF type:complete len:107 (-),score=25.02 TRINITY_DN3065_c0_g2_i1:53-373(-)
MSFQSLPSLPTYSNAHVAPATTSSSSSTSSASSLPAASSSPTLRHSIPRSQTGFSIPAPKSAGENGPPEPFHIVTNDASQLEFMKQFDEDRDNKDDDSDDSDDSDD